VIQVPREKMEIQVFKVNKGKKEILELRVK
jgi:hypothetical protein